MRIVLLLLFPVFAYCQLDTAHIYGDLSVSYMSRKDTVLISSSKWKDIISLIRLKEKTIGDYNGIIGKQEITIKLYDLQIAEMKSIERNLEDRVKIYQGAYEISIDKIDEINNLWQQGIKYTGNERKRGIFTGATWGIIGGFAAGIITSVILLK